MILSLQIKTITISFLYGIYFSFIIFLNYKLTYKLKKIYNILITFFVVFFNTLLYFIILLNTNNGIIHIYGLIAMLSGCLLEQYFEHLIENHHKKWYTFSIKWVIRVARKLSKTKKKRLVVFGTLSLIIIGYFIFSLGYNLYQLWNLKKENANLKEQLTEEKRQGKILRAEIEKLQDPEYIAAYARENYSYSKTGERIIKISGEKEKNKSEKEEELFDVNIDYNYIIYGGIGVLLLVFIYIILKKK